MVTSQHVSVRIFNSVPFRSHLLIDFQYEINIYTDSDVTDTLNLPIYDVFQATLYVRLANGLIIIRTSRWSIPGYTPGPE
jgi:hypothetical protein